MENEVLNTIFARSSIRDYSDEPLSEEEISALADAALASPTAMNLRAQRFFFITDKQLIDDWERAVFDVIMQTGTPESKERIADRKGKVFYNAPLFVAIAIDKKGRFSMADAGIASQTLALAAKSMGLDSVILGMPDIAFSGEKATELRARLGMDDNLDFGLGIAIGHAAMDKAPHESDATHVIYIRD